MLNLEAQAVDTQQIRQAHHVLIGNDGFQRLFNAIRTQAIFEENVLKNSKTNGSKRRIAYARRQEIVQKLREETERMYICKEDVCALEREYMNMCHHHACLLTSFIQFSEERLAVQKEKTLIRITGFARMTVDDIHEEKGLSRNNKSHVLISMLQACSVNLVSSATIPRLDNIDKIFEYFDTQHSEDEMGGSTLLFNAMQLLDVLCSQTWIVHGKDPEVCRAEQRQAVHALIKIIPHGFAYIRSWTAENALLVPVLVTQIFQTLHAVLMILPVLGSTSAGTVKEAMHSRAGGGDGGGGGGGGTKRGGRRAAMPDASNGVARASFSISQALSSVSATVTASTTSEQDASSTPSLHADNVYVYSWGDGYFEDTLAADVVLWLKTIRVTKLGNLHSAAAKVLDNFVSPKELKPVSLEAFLNKQKNYSNNNHEDDDTNTCTTATSASTAPPLDDQFGGGGGGGLHSVTAGTGSNGSVWDDEHYDTFDSELLPIPSTSVVAASAVTAAAAAAATGTGSAGVDRGNRTSMATTSSSSVPNNSAVSATMGDQNLQHPRHSILEDGESQDTSTSTSTASSSNRIHHRHHRGGTSNDPDRNGVLNHMREIIPGRIRQRQVCEALGKLVKPGSPLLSNILQCGDKIVHILLQIKERTAAAEQAASELAASTSLVSAPSSSASSSFPSSPSPSGAAHFAANARKVKHALQFSAQTSREVPRIPSIPIFGTPEHAVLLAALELGVISSGAYALHMGPQGSPGGVAGRDFRFSKALDKEVAAALHCASTAFAQGLLEDTARAILEHGHELSIHRAHSFTFISAWLKCAMMAALCCVEKEIVTDEVIAQVVEEQRREVKKVVANMGGSRHRGGTATTVAAAAGGGGGGGGGGVTTTTATGTAAAAGSSKASSAGSGGSAAAGGSAASGAGIPLRNRATAPQSTHRPQQQRRQLVSAVVLGLFPESDMQDLSLLRPLSTKFVARSLLVTHLSSIALRVMAVTVLMRHILSIAYTGMIVVRLLTRDLFIRRFKIEEYCSKPLLALLLPLLDEKTAMGLELADQEEEGADSEDEGDGGDVHDGDGVDGHIEDHTLHTMSFHTSDMMTSVDTGEFSFPNSPSSPSINNTPAGIGAAAGGSFFSTGTANSRPESPGESSSAPGSRAGSSSNGKSKVPTADVYWKDWSKVNSIAAVTAAFEGQHQQKMTYVQFLEYVGESHLQSKEVIEQFLLSVEQISSKSSTLKYLLVEAGIPVIVQRILDGQTDNIYLIALCEICLEVLAVNL